MNSTFDVQSLTERWGGFVPKKVYKSSCHDYVWENQVLLDGFPVNLWLFRTPLDHSGIMLYKFSKCIVWFMMNYQSLLGQDVLLRPNNLGLSFPWIIIMFTSKSRIASSKIGPPAPILFPPPCLSRGSCFTAIIKETSLTISGKPQQSSKCWPTHRYLPNTKPPSPAWSTLMKQHSLGPMIELVQV